MARPTTTWLCVSARAGVGGDRKIPVEGTLRAEKLWSGDQHVCALALKHALNVRGGGGLQF